MPWIQASNLKWALSVLISLLCAYPFLCLSPTSLSLCRSPNRKAFLVFLAWLVLGASYYLLYVRHHLKLGPEELFALSTRVTAEKMLSTGGSDEVSLGCGEDRSTSTLVKKHRVGERERMMSKNEKEKNRQT